MTGKQQAMSLDLPLSWTRSRVKSIHKKSFLFKTNQIRWISLAEIPDDQNFKQAISRFKERYPKGILLRGCSEIIADELQKRDFEIIPIGQEAVLDLNKATFDNRSLRQSARSGNRHNSIRKIDLNSENREKLNRLKGESRHGKKPQLKHLFIDSFTSCTECFIAENDKGWNAAITFSRVSPLKVQAELLLRKNSAAPGTMEALIEQVLIYLRNNGYLYFSLGEVPFELNKTARLSIKSRYLCKVGKAMHFAYNSHTLYRFKDKFSPVWRPVYLCGFPKISLLTLIEMGIRTNYLSLIISQLLRTKN
jgi:glycosyltransferase 2 family protein